MNRNLKIKRASLPYYKPFVIIDLDTNKVIKHCQTEKEAKQYLQLYKDAVIIPPKESPQQPNKYHPFTVAEEQMLNKGVEEKPIHPHIDQPTRRIEI